MPGWSGSIPIPRKMSGRAISTMEPSMVAISIPSVEMNSADPLVVGRQLGGRAVNPPWTLGPARLHSVQYGHGSQNSSFDLPGTSIYLNVNVNVPKSGWSAELGRVGLAGRTDPSLQ